MPVFVTKGEPVCDITPGVRRGSSNITIDYLVYKRKSDSYPLEADSSLLGANRGWTLYRRGRRGRRGEVSNHPGPAHSRCVTTVSWHSSSPALARGLGMHRSLRNGLLARRGLRSQEPQGLLFRASRNCSSRIEAQMRYPSNHTSAPDVAIQDRI